MMRWIAIIGAAALAAGCATSSRTAAFTESQPDEFGGPFACMYFPEIEAYLSPECGEWFWKDPQDGWRHGAVLPGGLIARMGPGFPVRLDCEDPQAQQARVMAKYAETLRQSAQVADH